MWHIHNVTLKEFGERLFLERLAFLLLCAEVNISEDVKTISPRLAPLFAEKLILDLSEDQARARIRSNPKGAAAFALHVEDLVHALKTQTTLASRTPSRDLTPFYLLSSLVIDAKREAPQQDLECFDFPDLQETGSTCLHKV